MRWFKEDTFHFPILPFWHYTPWGWVAVVLWDIIVDFDVEWAKPASPYLFGVILGSVPRKKKENL